MRVFFSLKNCISQIQIDGRVVRDLSPRLRQFISPGGPTIWRGGRREVQSRGTEAGERNPRTNLLNYANERLQPIRRLMTARDAEMHFEFLFRRSQENARTFRAEVWLRVL